MTDTAKSTNQPSVDDYARTSPVAFARRQVGRRRLLVGGTCGAIIVAAAIGEIHGTRNRAWPVTEPLDVPHVEGGTIRYSAAFAERAGIRATEAIAAPLAPVISAVGSVEFDPGHVAAVGARLNGFVARVAKFEGDDVEAGTVLATVESPELGEAQAAVLTLRAQNRAAESDLKRESSLLEQRLSTAREAEVATVEARRYKSLLGAARYKADSLVGHPHASRGRLGAQALRSPLKGIVVERNVAAGQGVVPDLVAFRIANVEHLWVELDVFEKSLMRVRTGDKVDLSPLEEPKQHYEARVACVGAAIDARTRSAPVRVEIGNRSRRLRVGQAVRANIYTSPMSDRNVTVVPTTSITLLDGKPTVFLLTGEHAVRVVPIDVGFNNGPETEVRRGIAPGDRVVSSGVFAVKSELFR